MCLFYLFSSNTSFSSHCAHKTATSRIKTIGQKRERVKKYNRIEDPFVLEGTLIGIDTTVADVYQNINIIVIVVRHNIHGNRDVDGPCPLYQATLLQVLPICMCLPCTLISFLRNIVLKLYDFKTVMSLFPDRGLLPSRLQKITNNQTSVCCCMIHYTCCCTGQVIFFIWTFRMSSKRQRHSTHAVPRLIVFNTKRPTRLVFSALQHLRLRR